MRGMDGWNGARFGFCVGKHCRGHERGIQEVGKTKVKKIWWHVNFTWKKSAGEIF